ncbi:ACP S-malonyltransferase [Aliikangiella marina]|uniref:Malonyl CoA-acyl carrier protein transacylase n=1 Tax=Aliikangiella marina TaxID=1712262 RepID=A0A545TJP9_9GAMM|nr:ACP S-malonyltransferase [Aliikangiella marina]TQV77438.1 ACP S-malonyltransferase [Aliikangiella marina]
MSDIKTAFVFPGQGSQSVAMMADFVEESIVTDTFQEASDALGYDMWKLVAEGPAESLNETQRTQPALLTASTALWRLWEQQGHAKPLLLAGHSLGEYSALVAAGALNFSDGVKLVEQRGHFMQQAVPAGTGKMAAIIGLADELIAEACQEAAGSEVVSPVNFNSPGQVVIAGNAEAVERAMVACKDKGAKRALPLPVSVPSHCSLMKPAAEKLADSLANIEIATPLIPVVNNVDVAVCESADDIKDALIRQLYCPVRWTESVIYLANQGINQLMECGPGNVLSGLARRIDRSLTAQQLSKKDTFNQ